MSEHGGVPATREQRSSPISTVMVSLISQLVSFSIAAAVLLKQQGTFYTKSMYVIIILEMPTTLSVRSLPFCTEKMPGSKSVPGDFVYAPSAILNF